MIVASFTDAWIETWQTATSRFAFLVASFTDAWIETRIRKLLRVVSMVASFTDAWIETRYVNHLGNKECRIFYRCVDWNKSYGPGVIACMVASFTDAWIETRLVVNVWFVAAVASFTDAWIETMRRHYIDVLRGSHLLQMRGLKHSFRENVKKDRSRIFYRCVDWNK